jgi:PBP1b-binding outer membrane lipoprotein LpoB
MKRLTSISLAAFALLLFGCSLLHAQPGFKESYTDTTSPFFISDNAHDYEVALKMARWSNVARQKLLVRDSARLVELTRMFNEHMAASGKAQPTEADIKLIAQIEKLAHIIREEMANAGALPTPPQPHPDKW